MTIDNWFKSLLLFCILIFLILFYGYSQNGRYISHFSGFNEVTYTVDTRTGALYACGAGGIGKFELPLGKYTISPIQKNDLTSK
jgi:hypothetical protein